MPSQALATDPAEPWARLRQPVRCSCGFAVFDGEVIRARVVRLLPRGAEAKCRCKRWVPVPVAYAPA